MFSRTWRTVFSAWRRAAKISVHDTHRAFFYYVIRMIPLMKGAEEALGGDFDFGHFKK